VAALLVLAGCSSGGSGGSAPSSSAAPSTLGNGAPKVTSPVDIGRYQQNPCGALTPTELLSFQVTTGQAGTKGTMLGQNNSQLGVDCTWLTSNNVGLSLSFTTDKEGLGFFYGGGSTPDRIPDIEGQPAVISAADETSGDCVISVGASDTAFYAATVKNDTEANPCTFAQQVLTAVTSNLKSSG
jgi:hypothetical protein